MLDGIRQRIGSNYRLGREGGAVPVGLGSAGQAADRIAFEAGRSPGRTATVAALGLGGFAGVNALANNPVGGIFDAVTFNAFNLRRDAPVTPPPQAYYPPPAQAAVNAPRPNPAQHAAAAPPQPYQVSQVGFQLPTLDEDELRRQRDYQERRVATDILTLQAINSAIATGGNV